MRLDGFGLFVEDMAKMIRFYRDVLVVDIVLSIKWGASLAEKLIYIFFMPTNYTLFIFILFAFQVIRQWMEILYNLSPNFG